MSFHKALRVSPKFWIPAIVILKQSAIDEVVESIPLLWAMPQAPRAHLGRFGKSGARIFKFLIHVFNVFLDVDY